MDTYPPARSRRSPDRRWRGLRLRHRRFGLAAAGLLEGEERVVVGERSARIQPGPIRYIWAYRPPPRVTLIWILLVAHLVGVVAVLSLPNPCPAFSSPAAPLVSAVWAASRLAAVRPTARLDWVEGLDLAVSFRVGPLGALLAVLVSGIGVLIFVTATASAVAIDEASPQPCLRSAVRCSASSGPTTSDALLVLGGHVGHLVPARRHQVHRQRR